MNLSISVKQLKNWAVVAVAGEVDVYTAPVLRKQLVSLIDDGRYFLVVDLNDVNFLDSTGLGVLIGALRRVRSHDGRLRISRADPKVYKVFKITGLTRIFAIFDSVDEAVAHEL